MAFIIKDRVKESTTSTGTGAITLGGAAATFDTFQSYMTNGDTTYYAIVHTTSGTDEWEVGLGTWNTGNTLTRTTVLAGSNGTSAQTFSAGAKDVFMTYPAAHAALAEDDVTFDNITVTGTVDGRDVAADGTKLDTVEQNADVTDAVNIAAAGALMRAGGTMTGNLVLNADPAAALGAATKQYVDTIASAGIHYHAPVRVEHPSNLNATYSNGSSGVGATLTNAGTNAALVLDSVSMVISDRVLVSNQTTQTQNGVYTVTTVGDGSTAWVLTRSTDTDTAAPSDPDAFGKGDAFFIKEGVTNAGHLDVLSTSGTIVFGTTNIVFSEVAETTVYSGGTGITLTGTTFAIGQDVGTTSNVTFNQVTAAIIGNVTGDVTGDLTGNADTATALATARTVQLSGDVTGSASFDGSANINITAAVQDDSHAHVISNVDGLQTALDARVPTSRTLTAGNGLTGGGDLTANRTFTVGGGTGITVNANDIAIDSSYTGFDSRYVNVSGDTMTAPLHVQTASAGTVTASTQADDLVVENSAEGGITIITPDDQSARIRFTSPSTNNAVGGATIFYRQNINKMNIGTGVSGGKLSLQSGAANETMILDGSGNVGIGTDSPSSLLTVHGSQPIITLSDPDSGSTSTISGNSGHLILNADSGQDFPNTVMDFQVDNDLKMRIDSSGVVEIPNSGQFKAASSNATKYVRMYAGATTGKWDIYGNGANLRISDNMSAGVLAVDTGATFGGSLGIGTTSVTDGSWGSGNTELAIDGTTKYGIIHLRGTGAGTTDTRYSQGVGDRKYYMAYDDVAGVHRMTIEPDGSITIPGTVDGRDLSVDGTKLDGIETGATADQTAAQILTAVKTVDGSGSGLDADLLDGVHASNFPRKSGLGSNSSYYSVDNWLEFYNTTSGLYWSGGTGAGWHIYPASTADMIIRSGNSSTVSLRLTCTNTTARGYLYANSSNQVGLLDAGGSWAIKHTNDSGTHFYTDGETEEFKVGRDTVTGNYGTVQTTTSKGGWGGYSIKGNWVFMGSDDNAVAGIYNDMENEWGLLARRNAEVELYYNGSLAMETVGSGIRVGSLGSSDIYMQDTDEGERRIHCNSNQLGFLDSSNSWSFYSSDDGTVTAEKAFYASSNDNKKIVMTGTTDPYIRWQEGTADRFYIQWRSAYDSPLFHNQQGGSFDFMPNASTGGINLRLKGSDDDIWGSVYADDNSNVGRVGFLNDDQEWAYRITSDVSHEWLINNIPRLTLGTTTLTLDCGTSSTLDVKCDDSGLALIRARGDNQGTGAIEVGQTTLHGGGMYYNGDGSPSFASGETADTIGFYRLSAGTRTEVFSYPYSSNNVTFNGNITAPDMYVSNKVFHNGDTDTYMSFGTNAIYLFTGGSQEVTIDTTGVRLGDSGNGYFQPVSSNYGSIQIDGGAHGGWEGYNIGGRAVFMHDNSSTTGLFNDIENEWLIRCIHNGSTFLYNNGSAKVEIGSSYMEMSQHLDMNNYDIYGVDQIFHHGDSNTYIQFHDSDQFRVVTGGTERLEVNNTRTQIDNLVVTGTTDLQGTVTGVSASATNDIFWENGQDITSSYTISSGKNAMSAGPLIISSNSVSVTIGEGEAWTIV